MEDRGQERSGTGGQKVSDEAKQKEEKRQLGAQEGAGPPPPRGWGESSRGSWRQEAPRKEPEFKMPEKLEGLGVAESILACVTLDGGRVLL